MKISIVVPIYNAGEYLDRCIQSILNQTYKHIEIILIDDGSTDDSKSICKDYQEKDNRIKFISQENKGVSAARNIGIREATGKFIGFVDSDDYIQPDMYETLYGLINKHNCDLSICGYSIIYPEYTKKSDLTDQLKTLNSEDVVKEIFIGTIKGFLWNKLFKRELFFDLCIPEDIQYGEDLFIITSMLIKHKNINSVYTSKALYNYMQISSSITNDVSKNFNLDGSLKIERTLEKMKELYFSNKEIVNLVNVSLAQSTLDVYRLLLLNSNEKYDDNSQYVYVRGNIFKYCKYYMRAESVKTKHKILYLLAILSPKLLKEVHRQKLKQTGNMSR